MADFIQSSGHMCVTFCYDVVDPSVDGLQLSRRPSELVYRLSQSFKGRDEKPSSGLAACRLLSSAGSPLPSIRSLKKKRAQQTSPIRNAIIVHRDAITSPPPNIHASWRLGFPCDRARDSVCTLFAWDSQKAGENCTTCNVDEQQTQHFCAQRCNEHYKGSRCEQFQLLSISNDKEETGMIAAVILLLLLILFVLAGIIYYVY
ncbi:hypothetical protein P4O66_015731, partial [Electrophorus voltai]